MVFGDTIISGEGGIPPVINTKSIGTAPTESNTDFFLLMAQKQSTTSSITSHTNCHQETCSWW